MSSLRLVALIAAVSCPVYLLMPATTTSNTTCNHRNRHDATRATCLDESESKLIKGATESMCQRAAHHASTQLCAHTRRRHSGHVQVCFAENLGNGCSPIRSFLCLPIVPYASAFKIIVNQPETCCHKTNIARGPPAYLSLTRHPQVTSTRSFRSDIPLRTRPT